MGKKKKVKPGDEEQYARFIEVAKKLDAADSEQKFEEATKRILARKKRNPENNFENSKSK